MRTVLFLCFTLLAFAAGCSRRMSPSSKPAASASANPTIDRFRSKRWRGPGDLPADRYRAAAAQIDRMPAYSIASSRFTTGRISSIEGSWEALGPDNVGGRTKALVIDPINPNTMYAGTATGGVWKTNDAGQTWSALTDTLPTLAVNSMAIDPSDHNILYVGTGEVIPGAGIFKTTDGGQTWSQLSPTANFAYVYSLGISSSRPADIYAGTDTGLWSSLDGGVTWTQSLPMPGGCFSTAVRGDQPTDIVFAACSQDIGSPLAYFPQEPETSGLLNGYSIYRNSDGTSSNWQMVFSAAEMGPTVLAVAPSAPDTIYALASDINPKSSFEYALAGLFVSDQGGVIGTWQQRAGTSNPNSLTANILSYPQSSQGCTYNTIQGYIGQGAWNLGLAVDPTNSQVVFAAGPRLSRSQDGGRTFAGLITTPNVLFHTDFHAFAFHPNYNGRANQTLFVTLDGGVYRSDSARSGATSTACGDQYYDLTGSAIVSGLQIAQFYHGAVASGGTSYLGGTQDTCTMVAGPGQTSWTVLYNGDGGGVAFDPSNAGTYYIESTAAPSNPPLLKTVNGGKTFNWVVGGITPGTGDGIFNALSVDPNAPQTVYYGLGSLWRSLDGAFTWSQISPLTGAPIAAIAVNPGNSSEVVFGNNSGRIYSGSPPAWNAAQPRSGYVSSLAFDVQHSGVVYATYATFRTQPADAQVYVSQDHGATWTALGASSLPDIPAHVLIVDPRSSSTLYIGTDMGVFVSFDSGNTWAHDSSFPNVLTESLVLDSTPGRREPIEYLYAFTHGRGAWKVQLHPPAGRSSPPR